MKETLLMKVNPKTLDNLMNELTSAIIQMKDVEPVQNSRFKDEVYTMCVCFQAELLQTIRNVELKNQVKILRITQRDNPEGVKRRVTVWRDTRKVSSVGRTRQTPTERLWSAVRVRNLPPVLIIK